MTNELHGVNPPLITPLDADGQLKDDAFRDEIRYHLDAGVSGVVVGGSTGEGMRMSNDQLQHLYEVAVDEVDGAVPVVAGVIARQTREATTKAGLARDAGADFLMVMPPTGYAGSHMADNDSIRDYYRAIADVSELPIVVYDVMSLLDLDAELVGDLVREIPEVVGIKVSSTLGNLTRYLRAIGDDGFVLGGMSIAQFPTYTLGVNGGIVGISSVCPRISVQIWDATQRGDYDRARELHLSIVPLIRAAMEDYESNFPAGEKAAIDVLGRDPGHLFHPFDEVTNGDEKRAAIEQAVAHMRERGTREVVAADD
ncbi:MULTISPECIES: dihydrodipicolinate synthase family protein [unclassified Haloferax]|uniref:dihydrodipicolinate synthase family protein n=1 Tax=unclassified Haloferax TaxID=2625095 RepID=UPI0002B2211B|nr:MULTISPECIES: dihydrodipicolinate synthase family protein [unclassified Haloferax]ELZ55946.1 dihydrodipicolinate synthase [Haloferax sp. ATCC BAA-646]ELZ67701.1 dihydrodipicolinate synthase [Haloferax sp. ATCC BAA-645]ELZ68272.1 dihydrodipicolinate synthase [Haloferax sp. ATCC BAA-644]